jgi:glutathione peroxidase
MAGLQVLEDSFKAQGFHVLGFFENDFGAQGGTNGQIDMCTTQYHVKFEQFDEQDVIGANQQPVWKWLLSQPNAPPMAMIQPSWNFNKYLISKDGKLVGHWAETVAPPTTATDPNFNSNPLVVAIKAELAK